MATSKKTSTTRAAAAKTAAKAPPKPAAKAAPKAPPKAAAKLAGKVAGKPAAKAPPKPAGKVAGKPAAKAPPKAAATPPATPAAKPAASPPAAAAVVTASKPTPASTPKAAPGAAAKPGVNGAFVPRSHPDAELTPRQTQALYEALLAERERLLRGIGEHLGDAITNIDPLADEMDIAQRHTEQAYLMRFADKERKLLGEIANALEKMQTGEYGICEGTGEPIAPKRLELRPWTRYSVKYKEQLELERKQHLR
jgi:DnaK suppressor protein